MKAILLGYGIAALGMLVVYQDLFFARGHRLVMSFELFVLGTLLSACAHGMLAQKEDK